MFEVGKLYYLDNHLPVFYTKEDARTACNTSTSNVYRKMSQFILTSDRHVTPENPLLVLFVEEEFAEVLVITTEVTGNGHVKRSMKGWIVIPYWLDIHVK